MEFVNPPTPPQNVGEKKTKRNDDPYSDLDGNKLRKTGENYQGDDSQAMSEMSNSTTIVQEAADALIELTAKNKCELIDKSDLCAKRLFEAIPDGVTVDVNSSNHPDAVKDMINDRLSDECMVSYILNEIKNGSNSITQTIKNFTSGIEKNKIENTLSKLKQKQKEKEQGKIMIPGDLNKTPDLTVDGFFTILVSSAYDSASEAVGAFLKFFGVLASDHDKRQEKVTGLFILLCLYLSKNHNHFKLHDIYTAPTLKQINEEIDAFVSNILLSPGEQHNASVIAMASRLHHEKYNIDPSVVHKIKSDSQEDDTQLSASIATDTVVQADRVTSLLLTLLFRKEANDDDIRECVLNELIPNRKIILKQIENGEDPHDIQKDLLTNIEKLYLKIIDPMLNTLRSENQYDIDDLFFTGDLAVETLPGIGEKAQRELDNINHNNNLRRDVLRLMSTASIHLSNGNSCDESSGQQKIGQDGGKKAKKTKKRHVKGIKQKTKKQKRNARKTRKKQKKSTRRRKH